MPTTPADDIYTISELATEFSITLRSIRFYENQGLLTPQRRGTQRIFSRQDRARLKLILRGKRLGFSLTDINELFTLYDTRHNSVQNLQAMLNTIHNRQVKLQQQQADINILMMELNAAERRCIKQLQQQTETEQAT